MKHLFSILLAFFLACFPTFAGDNISSETVEAERGGVKISRKVALLDIEGQSYYDVTIHFESLSKGYFTDPAVKVKVYDKNKKKVWQKRINNSYLFIFSSGQIQVGRPRFVTVLIGAPSKMCFGEIRLSEGIY